MSCCDRTPNFLATDNCPPSEAADVLGGPQTVEAMKKTEAGVRHAAGANRSPRLVAAAPDLALQGTLGALPRKLIVDQKRLLDGQRRMGGMHLFPELRRVPDLIKRDFAVPARGRRYVGDIACLLAADGAFLTGPPAQT